MYKQDNTAYKINQNIQEKKQKIIKLKKINKFKKKLRYFCFTFSIFSLVLGGIFYFLFGQAKMNELTYKMSKNLENLENLETKTDLVLDKNLEKNTEQTRNYATEDQAIIYQ